MSDFKILFFFTGEFSGISILTATSPDDKVKKNIPFLNSLQPTKKNIMYSYTTIVLKWNIKYESSRMNVPLSSSVVVIFEVTLWSSSCCGVASIVVKKTSEIFFYHNIHSKKSCSFDALQYFLRVLC